MNEDVIQDVLSKYLIATGMESIDPAKMGSQMLVTGFNVGVEQVMTELRQFLPEWNYPSHVIGAICLEIKARLSPHIHVWTRTIQEREDGKPMYCESCGTSEEVGHE